MVMLKHVLSGEVATLEEWRELFRALGLPEESRSYYWAHLRPVMVWR